MLMRHCSNYEGEICCLADGTKPKVNQIALSPFDLPLHIVLHLLLVPVILPGALQLP